MSSFENFDPKDGDVPGYPFFELWAITWDARKLVEGLSRDELCWIEQVVEQTVSEMRAVFVAGELEDYIKRIIEEQSWELGYLSNQSPATPEAVRQLLEAWPSDADDQPDRFAEDDLSRVDALEMAVLCGQVGCSRGDIADEPIRCAAVLSLMCIGDCMDTLECAEEDLGTADEGPVAARLISAANAAIEAAQALALASVFAKQTDLERDHERTLCEHAAGFSKERARQAARKRHAAAIRAMQFVKAEWEAHAAAYKFNKSDFARTYADLVRAKFKDNKGDPFSVTIKTITDVWLRSSPSAGKQAGLPAAG